MNTNTNHRNIIRRLAAAAVLTATVATGTLVGINPASAATSNTALEQQVIQLTNQHRATVGCGPLTGEARLSQAARAHSANMADNGFFDHTDPQGRTPSQRITATGYQWNRTSENIAAGSATAEGVLQQWLNSPGHRANIENCAVTQIGVGHGHNPTSQFGHYWTQKFANPTDPATTIPLTPTPQEPAPATPAPTTPAPTVPAPTVPAPTVPAPTTPAPTVPAPQATNPFGEPCEEVEDFDGDLVCWIGDEGWYLN